MTPRVRARVWPTDGPQCLYPERAHPLSEPRPRTGVCFSGGSTRSYAATVGQLRGLTATGLIEKVGYLSAVSGAAWAVTPYVYYPPTEGIVSDLDMLGAPAEPEDLDTDTLSELDPRALGFAATIDFAGALASARHDQSVPRDEVWTRAVGCTFLGPYGLYDPKQPIGFTLNDATAREIRGRHPSLEHLRLHTVRHSAYRPYLLVHSALNWPGDASGLAQANLVEFEYSPLGIGSAVRLTLRSGRHAPHVVGGGFIEPFAFGSDAPNGEPGPDGSVAVTLPSRPFALADALAASSAFSTADRDLRTYPHAMCWPVDGSSAASASSEVFTDGGDIDNYGLLSLLRRGVRAVVVFVNTVWPLSLDYDPSNWPTDLNEGRPTRRQLDPFLAPLFGAPSTTFPHNHVFARADYSTVVSGLQAAKRRGDTVMTTTRHVVQANRWWGIDGGAEVTVCWCYNDHVERWAERLPAPLRRLVRNGQSSGMDGPFARFPHYLTREQNPGALIRLTPAQVNLLSHLTCWNVIERRDALHELFDAG